MGYTHYWYRPVGSEIAPDVWDAICEDARVLIKAAPCKVVADYDRPTTPPLINSRLIAFNGSGNSGHETFWFERVAPEQRQHRKSEPEVFAFCKTDWKPYDQVVCAILAVIAERTDTRVQSDGSLAEWEPALTWASQTLGRVVPYPVKEDPA
jgi:hypothetical protein